MVSRTLRSLGTHTQTDSLNTFRHTNRAAHCEVTPESRREGGADITGAVMGVLVIGQVLTSVLFDLLLCSGLLEVTHTSHTHTNTHLHTTVCSCLATGHSDEHAMFSLDTIG